MRSIGLRLPKDIDEHLAEVEQKDLPRVIIEALREHWIKKSDPPKRVERELTEEEIDQLSAKMVDVIPEPLEFACPVGSIPAPVHPRT